MKEIIKYLMKYKSDAYKAIGVSILVAGLSTAIPAIYGRLLDLILKNNIDSQVYILLGVWLAISLATSVLNRYIVLKKHNIAIRCDRDLVAKASVHLVKMPISFHKDKKAGEVFDKITRAGNNLHNIISQVVVTTVPKLFTFIIILIVLLSVNYYLFFIVLAIVVIYTLVTINKTRPLETAEEDINEAFEDANGDIQDSVSNAKAVKSFVAEDLEEQKYLSGNQKIFDKFLPLIDIGSRILLVQSNILETGLIILVGASLVLLSKNEITVGELVMVIGYARLIYEPLSNLSDNYILIKRGLVSVKGIEIFMQQAEESYAGGIILKNVKGEIRFDDVSFAYNGDQNTLKNISFTANKGEMIAFVGETGAGKTTLLELIPRFIKPKSGRILLDGVSIAEINLCSLRDQIGIVPQDIVLFNESVMDNIRFGRSNATDKEVVQAAKEARAYDFIQKMPKGFEQLVGERGYKLSGGERQRIAIARALLKKPKILILDEATSALDSGTEKIIQETLKELIKTKTVTIFVIAHRFSTIKKSNKILVLSDGMVVERGNHEELVAIENGFYRQSYEEQNF